MTTHRQQIAEAVRATTIRADSSFTWFGQLHRPPALIRDLKSANSARQHLVHALQRRLYSDFYLSGGAVARRRERTALPVPATHAFITGLEAANRGLGTWSTAWTELSRTDDEIVVHNEQLDLALWLNAGDVRYNNEGDVAVRLPASLPAWSPGFWFALGDVPQVDRAEANVRFYWNLRPDGAALLVEHATHLLNGAGIPFRLKLLSDPARYTRCDAAVLYLPESAIERAMPVIQAIYEQIQPALKPAVPALTARLEPGLAIAKDPDGDESFGSRCCRLMAGALIAASEAGVAGTSARLVYVLSALAENDIAIERPALIGGWNEARPTDRARPDAPARDNADYTRIAAGIAERIVADAIWDWPVCAWLGATGDIEHGRPVYGTLGPDLYGGSAGIALFLGDAYRATGDATCRTTALGGIRHALAHARQIPPASIHGLYTGLPGVSVAAAWLAGTLQEPSLLDDANRLLDTIDERPSREHDLVSGTAGALLAVVLLHQATPDERLLNRALRLGDRLLDSAHRGAGGYSWRSGRRALTGLSHGASGVGVALLELAVATGHERFLDAAHGAFAWERRLFDADAGDWPDLRRVNGPVRRSVSLPFGTSWCHGAPGIALARLRAAGLLADDKLAAEARVALETTRRWIEPTLATGDESFCLCHGLAGNADVLIEGYAALGDPAYRAAALAVADAGIERYAADPNRWPCGTYGGATPGLMLGLAGIGHFYLRLANPALPSILLPVPESSRASTTG